MHNADQNQQENTMLNDVTVYGTYTDIRNEVREVELTLTGKQIEQTMLRRMQTLMPTARNIQFQNNRPDSHQLEMKAGKK